jgi:hypothetical protein
VRSRKKRGGRRLNGNLTPSKVGSQSDIHDTRKLDNILRDLTPLVQRGRVTRFLNSTEDVDRLGAMVGDIRDAMVDYQVSAQSTRSHLG